MSDDGLLPHELPNEIFVVIFPGSNGLYAYRDEDNTIALLRDDRTAGGRAWRLSTASAEELTLVEARPRLVKRDDRSA